MPRSLYKYIHTRYNNRNELLIILTLNKQLLLHITVLPVFITFPTKPAYNRQFLNNKSQQY